MGGRSSVCEKPDENGVCPKLSKEFIAVSQSLRKCLPEYENNLKKAMNQPNDKCVKNCLEQSQTKIIFSAEKLIRARPRAEHEAARVLDETRQAMVESQCKVEQKVCNPPPEVNELLQRTRESLHSTCRDMEIRAAQLRSSASSGCYCRGSCDNTGSGNTGNSEMIGKLTKAATTTVEVT